MTPVVLAPHLIERFWSRVDRSGSCWLWTGGLQANGYGQVSLGHRTYACHRLAWELANGPIPRGLCVCHNCDTSYPIGATTSRRCVNPDHLFLGTNAENTADARRKGRLATGDRSGARLHRERMPRGERHYLHQHPELARGERSPSAVLTENEVMAIRWQYARGAIKAALARRYGVSRATIYDIVTYGTWSHLP